MLSGLYQAQGRYPDAIDAYLEAKGIRCTLREICPASDQKLARLYRAAGDLAAAAEQYAGFLEASCNGSYDRETRKEYAAVLTEMGDHRRVKAVRSSMPHLLAGSYPAKLGRCQTGGRSIGNEHITARLPPLELI